MSTFDIRIVGDESGITFFDNGRRIAKPFSYLVKTDPSTSKKRGEGVSHTVGRYPSDPDFFYVIVKGARKVVAVAVLAVFNLGLQHEWFAQPVGFQERQELACEWDGAFLPVLKIDGGRFPQVKQSRLQVKPEGSSLYYLVLPQPGVESAVEYEQQIFPFAGRNELVALLAGAEPGESPAAIPCQIQSMTRVTPNSSPDINAPFEKGTQLRCVSVGRRTTECVVVLLKVGGSDSLGAFPNPSGEGFQGVPAPMNRTGCKNVLAPFVGQEGFYLGVEGVGLVQGRVEPHFPRPLNCFRVIVSLKADEMANTGYLEVQPVNRAAPVDAGSFGSAHGAMSHFTVTLRQPVLLQYSRYLRGTGQRVMGFEPTTSSLARGLSVEGTVTGFV